MAKIIPTVLTNSEEEYCKRLRQIEHITDLIQIDIIDGKFAPNTTVGTDVIGKYPTSAQLEAQLMVNFAEGYIRELAKLEYMMRIILPFEGKSNISEAIYQVKKHDKQVGISLNPGTPVSSAQNFFDEVDLLLLLSVDPGFSGQKFQPHVIKKVQEAKHIVPGLAVEVDGGVDFENAPLLARAGADFLCANRVLYGAPDFRVAYEKLAKLASIDN